MISIHATYHDPGASDGRSFADGQHQPPAMNEPRSDRDRHARRSAVRALVLAVAVAAVAALPSPAAAHAVLERAEPGDGSRVTGALSEVVLEFSGPVSDPEVSVEDPVGQNVAEGPPEPADDGALVRQPVGPVTELGTYTVTYRVTSADGHVMDGTFPFEYAGPTGEEWPDDTVTEADPREARDVLSIVTGLWPVWVLLAAVAVISVVSWRLLRRVTNQEPGA